MLLLAAHERAKQEHHGVVFAHLRRRERVAVGAGDAAGCAQVVDNALCGTFSTVVTVEAPRVELGVAGQVQLQRAPVEVVEVDFVAAEARRARGVVPAGIAAEVEEVLGVGAVHVERRTAGLEEAHSHRLRSIVEGREDIRLVQAFDVHRVAHRVSFLRIFGNGCHFDRSVCTLVPHKTRSRNI